MFTKSPLALVIGAIIATPVMADSTATDEHMVVEGREYGYKAESNSTAMRMEATQLETPGQVAVIGEQLIDEQRASTLGEVLKNDASITAGSKSTNRERFNLRGFELDSGSSYLRDGAQHWSHYRQPIELLERVEVLKGPAGLLYGESTPGGLVNMISKKPTYETQVNVSQDIGSNNYTRTMVDVSGALNEDESLRARVVLSQEDQDSWRTRFDGTDVQTERFVGGLFVDYDINEDVMLSFHYDRTQEQGDLDNGSKIDTATGQVIDPSIVNDQKFAMTDNDITNYGVAVSASLNDSWSVKSGISRQFYERQRTESDNVLDKVKDSNGATVGYGYRAYDRHDEWTFDTAYVDFTGDFDALGVNHRLLVGANGLHYDYKQLFSSTYACQSANQGDARPECDGGFSKPDGLHYSNDDSLSHSKEKHYGIYVQDLVTFNDQWQALAGVRFAYDKTTSSKNVEASYNNVLPKLGLIYSPVENGSIYLTYSESFEPVADISDSNDENFGQSQDPKKGTLYELGSKWELFDDRLFVSGALFHITQSNMQITEDLGSSQTRTTQVGEQVHTGAELSATGYVTESFSVSASTMLLDAEFNNDPELEGKTPADVAEFTASIWSTYSFNNGTDVNLGVYHVGDRWAEDSNEFKKDAYTRVDLGVSHTLKYDENLEFIARFNVENLFDTDYLEGGSTKGVVVGEGRNYMATLQVKY
ncbi:TonB-dependent siderophore receptor [Vibrio sp. LaRot3]|uniref:TonB-dependent siderophore receptor n=1 Tax=Vibrio sp. LaRot3 TaxID=2998829 RepID=UPI0022CE18D9|nr:TonB-dependent receptor [Vibrio sp. LaRot3]MDA0147633.1 TonB-dependent receptor [Vibrio sp. LaRot3]